MWSRELRPSRSKGCVSTAWKGATFRSFVRWSLHVLNVVENMTLRYIERGNKGDRKSNSNMMSKRSKSKSKRSKRKHQGT